MNKHLYEKLAITNIRKNGKLYLPYLLTIIGSMMFYYILTSIANNPTIYDTVTKKEAFKGAEFLCQILQAGSFVAALFAFLFAVCRQLCSQASEKAVRTVPCSRHGA